MEPVVACAPLELETLEPRVLLTTLFGGDVFEYEDPEGNTIRVALEADLPSDLIVELIGSEVDAEGTLRLGDLPGRIIAGPNAGTNIGGGPGGDEGVDELGDTPVLDLSSFDLGTFTLADGPNDAINIEALAGLTEDGRTLGFNFGTADVNGQSLPLIQLVAIDVDDNQLGQDLDGDGEPDAGSNGDTEAFVNAVLSQAMLDGDVETELTGDIDSLLNIDAFSVDPDNADVAYALVDGQLHRIDRTTGEVTRIGAVQDQQTEVNELDGETFSGDLVGFSTDGSGNIYSLFDDELLYNGLFVNDTDSDPVTSVNGDLGDQYNFVALAVNEVDDGPDITYAVNETATTLELYQIDRDAEGGATGATRLGVLTDINGEPITGVRSLTFNEDGELFAVGSRPGRAQELFQIDPTPRDLDGDEQLDEIRATALSLAFSRDGDVNGLSYDPDSEQFYGIVRIGDEDRLVQIPASNSAGPSSSTVLTDSGDVSDYLQGLSSDELNQFYSIFNRPAMNGALLFNAFDHIPVESIGNDLADDFSIHGLAVVPRPFFLEAVGGSGAAAALGIDAADGDDGTKDGRIEGSAIVGEGQLTLQTALADISGFDTEAGPDLRLIQQDGSTFTVDLSDAVTVNDLLDAINNAPGGDVTASINPDGTGLVLADQSTTNAVDRSELIFVAETEDGTALELRIALRNSDGELDDPATLDLGDLTLNGDDITNVSALTSDAHGRLFFVGQVSGQFRLFQAVVERTGDGTPTGFEIEENWTLTGAGLGNGVNALAMADPLDRSTIFGVADVGGQDRLVRFRADGSGQPDGFVQNLGAVQVDGEDTRIVGMEFDPATGHLVAVDKSQNPGDPYTDLDAGDANQTRLVRIVGTGAEGQVTGGDGSNAVQQTTPGSVPANLAGYALDEAGALYSIADVGVTDGDGNVLRNDQVWVTGNNFSPLAFVNGDLGANQDFIELTVIPDSEGGTVYAIAPLDGGASIGLYRVDGADPSDPGRTTATGLTFLGKVTNEFGAAIDGVFDIESDEEGNLLIVGRNLEAPLPVVTVGQTSELDAPGTDFDSLLDLTVTDTERIFAIDDRGGDGYQLLELERIAPNRGGLLNDVLELGTLRTSTNQVLDNVDAIATDMSTGKVYIAGSVSGADRALYEVNINSGIVQQVAALTENGTANDGVTSLAFANGTLYATTEDGGSTNLHSVNLNTGAMQDLGEVLASDTLGAEDESVTIESMAANAQGGLVAVHNDGGVKRLVAIDPTEPGEARFTTNDGGDSDDNLNDAIGLASDSFGLFYSLYDDNSSDNIQLRSNSNVIYQIDPEANPLQDLDGDGLEEEIEAQFVNYLTRENPWSGDDEYIPIVADVTQIAFIDEGPAGRLQAIVDFDGVAVPFTDARDGSAEDAAVVNLGQTHGRFSLNTGQFLEPDEYGQQNFPGTPVTLREFIGLEGGTVVGMEFNSADEVLLLVEREVDGETIRDLRRIHYEAHWTIHRERLFPSDEIDDDFDVEIPATEVDVLTGPGSMDANLVGFAADSDGNVFYSIYDDDLLNNFLVRSFYDVPYDAEGVGNYTGHLPQPEAGTDLGGNGSAGDGDDDDSNSPNTEDYLGVDVALSRLVNEFGVELTYALFQGDNPLTGSENLLDQWGWDDGANYIREILRDADGVGQSYGDLVALWDNISDATIGELYDLDSNPEDLDAPRLASVLSDDHLSGFVLVANTVNADGDQFVIDENSVLWDLGLDRDGPLSDARAIIDSDGGWAILGINALANDPGDAGTLYAVGLSAEDILLPDAGANDYGTVLDEGLGDVLDIVVNQLDGDGFVVRDDTGSDATILEYFTRDGSGNVDSTTDLGELNFGAALGGPDADGNDNLLYDVNVVTIADGELIVSGIRLDAPIPNANIGDDLASDLDDGDWNVQGIAGDRLGSDGDGEETTFVVDRVLNDEGDVTAHRLLRVDRVDGGETSVSNAGNIRLVSGEDTTEILNIQAITEADSDNLYVVGDAGGDTPVTTLYEVNKNTGVATAVDDNDDGLALATADDAVTALFFDSDSNTLHAVREGTELGTIDLVNGDFASTGPIGLGAEVTAMTFNHAGDLVAFDDSQIDTTGRRLIEIDASNGSAEARTNFGEVDEDLRGLRVDDYGRFYSIHNNDGGSDQLWVSATSLFQLDQSTGDIENSVALTADGDAVTDIVRGLDFNDNVYNGNGFALVQDDDGGTQRLLTNIELGFSGNDLVSADGAWPMQDGEIAADIEIGGMGIDTATSLIVHNDGTLVAVDTDGDNDGTSDDARLIQLNRIDPASSTALSDPGAFDSNYAGLAIDEDGRVYTINTGDGDRLIASDPDNAPQQLATVDTTTGSATTDAIDGGSLSPDNPIQALVVNPNDTSQLFAVYRDGSQDQFVVIDSSDGSFAQAPQVVEVGGDDTRITGFDFAHGDAESGGLLAVDNRQVEADPTNGRARLLRIDTDNPADSEVVTTASGDTRFAGAAGQTVLGFSIDNRDTGTGRAFSFNEATGDMLASGQLFGIGFNIGAPILTGSVGGSLGADSRGVVTPQDFNIVDIAVAADGAIYAINDRSYVPGMERAWELWQLDRDPATGEVSEFANLGVIADFGADDNELTDIHSLDYNAASNLLTFVGVHEGGAVQRVLTTGLGGGGFGTGAEIFEVSDDGEGGTENVNVTTSFDAVAVHKRNQGNSFFNTLYAVTESADGIGQDLLVITLDGSNDHDLQVGEVLARVELPDDVNISYMDFNREGVLDSGPGSAPSFHLPDLIAIDGDYGEDDRQLIKLDFDTELLVDPAGAASYTGGFTGDITVLTDPEVGHHTIDPRMVGYASNPADGSGVGGVGGDASPEWGRFFSLFMASDSGTVFRNDVTEAGFRARTELWISGNELFAVSPDTGVVSSQGAVVQADPDGFSTGTQESDYAAGDTLAQWESIQGFAYNPDGSQFFAVQRDLQNVHLFDGDGEAIDLPSIDRLLTINVDNGEFERIGRVMARPSGDQGGPTDPTGWVFTEIESMDFDADNELIAVDALNDSTLQLDLTSPSERTLRMSRAGDYNEHLYGYASDSDGHFYSIWEGLSFHIGAEDELWVSQSYVPNTNVNGDLDSISFGGDEGIVEDRLWTNALVPVGVTIDDDGNTYIIAFNPDLNRTELFALNRDDVTGLVLNDIDMIEARDGSGALQDVSQASVDIDDRRAMDLQGHITDANGNRFLDISALATELTSGDLYAAGFNIEAPVPEATVGGDLGGQFAIRGMAVAAGDVTYVLASPGGSSTANLYRVERNADGQISDFVLVGNTGLGGSASSLAVVDVDGEEQLWTVANGSLQVINPTTGAASAVASLSFTQFLPEPDSEEFDADGQVKALLHDEERDRVYFVFDTVPEPMNPGLGSPNDGDFLASASLADLVAGLGGLQFDGEIIDGGGNDVDIVAAAVNGLGQFVAIDRFTASGAGADDHRLIRFDLVDDPLVNVWQVQVDAQQITTPGSVDSGLAGLAIDSAGRALSVQTDPPGDNDQLWASSGELFKILTDSGEADSPVDANGDGLELELVRDLVGMLNDGEAVTEHIGALAFRGEGDEAELFALRRSFDGSTDQLVELSLESGDVSGLGDVLTPAGDMRGLGMAFTTDGRLIAVDGGLEDVSDRRMVEIQIPELAETIGVIQVDDGGTLEDTNIQDAAFVQIDGEWQLVGFDDSQEGGRRLIQIDLDDPTNDSEALTAAGTVSERLVGVAAGELTGQLYSIFTDEHFYDALMTSDLDYEGSDEAESLIPRTNVNGDLGGYFSVRTLAVGDSPSDDAHMIVWDAGVGQFLLYRIEREADGSVSTDTPLTLIGPVQDENGNPFVMPDVNLRAMDRASNGDLHVVANAIGGFDGQELFRLNLPDSNGDPVVAESLVELSLPGFGNVQDPVTALSARPGGRFQAIVLEELDNGQTQSRLIEIIVDPEPGQSQVSNEQVIEVEADGSNRNTEIIGFDTDPLGTLIALDEHFGNDDRRLLTIGNTLLVGPSAPLAMGFASLEENGSHQLYVITRDYDDDPTADATGDGSTTDVALIQIDRETGEFDRANDVTVITVGGEEVTAAYSAMAFDRNEPGFVYVAADGEEGAQLLQRLRVSDGAVQSEVTVTVNGENVEIESLAFAHALDANGNAELRLVGVDTSAEGGARLLGLDPTTGEADILAVAGTIRNVGGLSHFIDESTGRQLLLTTDDDALIRGTAVSLPVNENGISLVESVLGADINPVNGWVYFTAQQSVDGEEDAQDFLYRLRATDADTGEALSRAQTQGSLERIGRIGSGNLNISSLVWDQNGSDAVLMGISGTTGQLILIDPDTGAQLDSIQLTLLNEEGESVAAEGISGIELVRATDNGFESDDSNAFDTRLVAVQRNGEESQLLAFELTRDGLGGFFTQQGEVLGSLPDPEDDRDNVRGTNIGGLTWYEDHPALGDGLIGTDVGTDELLWLDPRRRFESANLFSVYVAQSSPNARISIAQVDPIDPENPGAERFMRPYEDSAGQIRVVDPDDAGDTILVDAPENSGIVYIGARTPGDGENEETANLPLLQGELDTALGWHPGGTVSAGIHVANDFDGSAQSIDRILVGGTVTGEVDISGSADLFYSGWLITGDIHPTLFHSDLQEDNFQVGGDLQNLITAGSIGGLVAEGNDPTELLLEAETDIRVVGRVGQIQSIAGSMLASLDVRNRLAVDEDLIPTPTLEQVARWNPDDDADDIGSAFQNGELALAFNDFDNPYYLQSLRDYDGDQNVQSVTGTLRVTDGGAPIDTHYYGVSLLAGQTVSIQLRDLDFGSSSLVKFGVFDPDGRLVMTNYPEEGASDAVVSDEQFQFTPDQPGTYRIAVAHFGDTDFDLATDGIGSMPAVRYQLTVRDAGALAVGGVAAAEHVNAGGFDDLLGSARQDFGAVYAGGVIADTDLNVRNGSLRSVDAASIGFLSDNVFGDDPRIHVPDGDVGLVRATDPSGVLSINTGFVGDTPVPIGGSYQVIDAAGLAHGAFLAGDSIGVLRVGGTFGASNVAPVIEFNTNGGDGTIDLIDVQGDFGGGPGLGPQITAHNGGNVRYLTVGGTIYQDAQFGGGNDVTIGGTEGQVEVDVDANRVSRTVSFTDDSGGEIFVRATNIVTDPEIDLEDFEDDPDVDIDELTPELAIRTYGIRGSGGVVIADITTDASLLVVNGDSRNAGNAVELGQVFLEGEGTAVELDPVTGEVVPDEERSDAPENGEVLPTLGAVFNGAGDTAFDVFRVTGGDFNLIRNNTAGELVNVVAESVTDLRTFGNLGYAYNDDGVLLRPGVAVIEDEYPFLDQRTAIQIAGDAGVILAHGGIGNVIVDGDLGHLLANNDQSSRNVLGEFEGINAPVLVRGILHTVDVGHGIAPTGSGEFSQAGLYVEEQIRLVTSSTPDAYIRGNIVVSGVPEEAPTDEDGNVLNVPTESIARIAFDHATIAGASILTTTSFEQDSDLWLEPRTLTGEIGDITISGRGGIIGSEIIGRGIGDISVPNGFGIINTYISSVGPVAVGDITAGGLGLRSVDIIADGAVGDITALGNGEALDIRDFTDLVRQSESSLLDQGYNRFGELLHAGIDLHRYTAGYANIETTSRDNPIVEIPDGAPAGTVGTNAGLIDDVDARGPFTLGRISAWGVTNSSFNFANEIEALDVREKLENVEMTTGSMRQFQLAMDAVNFDLTVAGRLDRAIIRGDLLGGSSITASGPTGDIGVILIFGDLVGDINAVGSVNLINVRGDISGNIDIDGRGQPRFALNTLKVGGSLSTGSLSVNGDINTIITQGDFGSAGEELNVTGDLNNLRIGGALEFDELNVDGDLRNLMVLGGGIAGDVAVLGDLNNVQVRGGDVEGDIIAGGDLRTVRIIDGDLGATGSIVSTGGDIYTVLVINGDLLGDVLAPQGEIRNIKVIGSDVAGRIEAGTVLRSVFVQGDLLASSAINVDGELFNLNVRGAVRDGATIDADALRVLNVNGAMQGDLTVGAGGNGFSRVIVGGNLGTAGDGSALAFDRDAQLIVRGNVGSDVETSIGGDLQNLNVNGQLRGQWLIDGQARTIIAGSMDDAVIVTGKDLWNLNIRGEVDDSLVQAGLMRTGDTFANGDTGMATIRNISVNGAVRDSILAAGHEIWNLNTNGSMVDSSVSSGFVVNGDEVDELLDGNRNLNGALDRNAIRTDGTLYNGEFRTANIGGSGLVNSHLSAGTDASANGDFINVGVSDSLTGGASGFNMVNAAVDANSAVLADGGINNDRTSGAGQVSADIGYNLNSDLLGAGNELTAGDLLQTITQNNGEVSLNINGRTLKVQLNGPGQVQVYYSGGDDVDALVLNGTTSNSTLNVTTSHPNLLGIERLVSTDDSALRQFDFNGDIVGSGTDSPDLWIDGGATMVSFRNVGDASDWSGAIGSGVNRLQLHDQGSGDLMIGGDLNRYEVTAGDTADDRGLVARDIRSLNISDGGQSFDGRIESNGDSLNNALVQGDFGGEVVANELNNFRQINGDFTGSIETSGDARVIQVNGGNVGAGASINVGGEVINFIHQGDTFAGAFSADAARNLNINAEIVAAGSVNVTNAVNVLNIGSHLRGDVNVGEANRINVNGAVTPTAELIADGGVTVLNINGNVNGNSSDHAVISVDGEVRQLLVGGDVNGGEIGIRGDLQNGIVRGEMRDAILTVGGDINRVNVNNHVEGSIVAAGTWWGDDAAYNTDDDVIYGGSINMMFVGRDFVRSVVAAGVLPGLHHGEGIPDDLRAYTGNENANDIEDVDSAEAGGVRPSEVSRLIIRGGVFGNGANQSAVVAADHIDMVQQSGGVQLDQRTYENAPGAPELVADPELLDNGIRLYFSEVLNTASLSLETDSEDGTIELRDGSGDLLEDLFLSHDTRLSDEGVRQSVLTITKPGGLPDEPLVLTVSGGGDNRDELAIHDRSGGRSALRDFDGDGAPAGLEEPFGGNVAWDADEQPPMAFRTIFDGNGDGVEGGDAEFTLTLGLPSTFADAQVDLPLNLDGESSTFNNSFTGTDDRDVYRFAGEQGQYFSAALSGASFANMALFWENPDSGEFEAVVRYQGGLFGHLLADPDVDLFDALQLPEDGTYFLVVTPDQFGFDPNADYQLEMNLASTSAGLTAQLGGELPDGSRIVDANNGKQLIHLNFEGGLSTKVGGNINFDPFDIETFTSRNLGRDTMIDQIVTYIGDIYEPLFTGMGAGGVLDGDLSDYEDADSGLYFVVDDPTTLDPSFDDPYSTVFVGPSDSANFGAYGIASQIDPANVDKDDEAVIFAETFSLLELFYDPFSDNADAFDGLSRAFANVIAHEAGHFLGLNHTENQTLGDDPQVSMMGSGAVANDPEDLIDVLWELDGSSPLYEGEFPKIGDGTFSSGVVNQIGSLSRWLSDEFPVGDSDEIDALLRAV